MGSEVESPIPEAAAPVGEQALPSKCEGTVEGERSCSLREEYLLLQILWVGCHV